MTRSIPPAVMVLLALAPGALVQGYLFGIGVWTNVAVAAGVAAAFESLLARTPRVLNDGSAMLTAALLALALPPGTPVGIVGLGALIGLGLGKHVFGEQGVNPFN